MDRKDFLKQGSMAMLGSSLLNTPIIEYSDEIAGGELAGIGVKNEMTLFLSGDVMTGRGIDQALPYSVDPQLYERYMKNARPYVEIAEQKNGPIPEPLSYKALWGYGLQMLQHHQPDVRIINLETAVTTSDEYWKGKAIHYRMHPQNVPLFSEAGIDVCVLGNNHMLDWGYTGLRETLNTLHEAGLKTAGAGLNTESAACPVTIKTGEGRLLIFSYGLPTSGIPMKWQAAPNRPGIHMLSNIDSKGVEKVTSEIQKYWKEGDRVLVSLHWGGNWGYAIPGTQQVFAHRLIDSGLVDIVHGHSSHHPKGIEVYNSRLVLYGCGDLINDYEGISGHDEYRDDLTLMYFPTLNRKGELVSLHMSPMQIYRFQLRRPDEEDIKWLRETLERECSQFGHTVTAALDGDLILHWNGG